MLGIGLGLCYLFVRSYVRSENRETPIYRAFCRETVRSLKKSQKTILAPPHPRTPALPKYRWLSRLPTPLRGGVLARGAGCKITAIKHFIPMLGIKCSHHGNNDNLCKMSLQNHSFTHFLFILFCLFVRVSLTIDTIFIYSFLRKLTLVVFIF